MKKIGLILNNIGSPQSYEAKDVGLYLNEFLMDKYIINIPFLIRFFLVKLIIVPRRKWTSALKYKSVWGNKKSPLITLTEELQLKLQQKLNNTDNSYFIDLGMRYGSPSIAEALKKMKTDISFHQLPTRR